MRQPSCPVGVRVDLIDNLSLLCYITHVVSIHIKNMLYSLCAPRLSHCVSRYFYSLPYVCFKTNVYH